MNAAGLRVVLVAKFNDRYHRTGGAIAAALRTLGAEVAECEERTRGLAPWLGRGLGGRLDRVIRGHRPDMVLVFKGGSLDSDTIETLRTATPARWINWFPDSPHLLDLSLRNGRGYDHTFIFDTSMVDRHRALGRRADYLPEGFDPQYHRPLADPEWPFSRVAFVGSREPFRAAALDTIADLRVSIWGPDWPRGPLYGDDFVRAFANADLALNIHQFFGEPADRGWYGTGANRRVFELAGIGTVQLCDAKADVNRNFRPDNEIVLFDSTAGLRARVVELLSDPGRRRSIADRARTRALAEHTWQHRLTELVSEAMR